MEFAENLENSLPDEEEKELEADTQIFADLDFKSLADILKGKLSYYIDNNGRETGEWTSVEYGVENSEFNVNSVIAKVHLKTDFGGENSKYTSNEDSAFIIALNGDRNDNGYLAVGVLDGAGGSKNEFGEKVGGKMASRIGSAAFAQKFRDCTDIKEAFSYADQKICRLGEGSYATCLILTVEQEGKNKLAKICYAGDCKATTIRNKRILKKGTTKMQNRALEIAKSEKEYYQNLHLSHIITNQIGLYEGVYKLESVEFNAKSRDVVVMASDGFWDIVSEYEVQEMAKQYSDSAKLQKELFELAYKRNNLKNKFEIKTGDNESVTVERKRGDNITLAVVKIN
jgi:serine/threonine protein phosphatase PrpC